MPENSSSRSLVLGFSVLCAFLIVAVSVAGYYGLKMQERFLDETMQCRDAELLVRNISLAFDVIQLTAARQEQTRSPMFAAEQHEALVEVEKAVAEAHGWMVHGNVDRIQMVMKSSMDFVELNRHRADLYQALDKRRMEQTKIALELRESIAEMIAERDAALAERAVAGENPEEGKGRLLPESTVANQRRTLDIEIRIERQHRLFERILFATNAGERGKTLEEFAKSEAEILIMLNDMKANLTTAAARDRLEKIEHLFEMNHHNCDEIVKMIMEADHVGTEMAKVAEETQMRLDELRESLAMRSQEIASDADAASRSVAAVLIVVSTLALPICIAAGWFVASRIGRPVRSGDYDTYTAIPAGESRDLRVVADKLQEVVDLLRR